jgi:hypothetical protein
LLKLAKKFLFTASKGDKPFSYSAYKPQTLTCSLTLPVP